MTIAVVVVLVVLAIAVALLVAAVTHGRADRAPQEVPSEPPAHGPPDSAGVAAEREAEPASAPRRGDAQKIRVLVCDDSEWYCDLVAAWFELEGDLELSGSAHDRASALEHALDLQPDVVVVDTMTSGLQPVTVADVRAAAPGARVLLCSGYPEAVATDRLGPADGYVSKDDGREPLIDTLRRLARSP